MATLEELTRHIAAAEDLQSVVRTMKAISAASIRRHEQAERAMADYLATVEMGLQVVLRALPVAAGASGPESGEARAAVVIIGSEIGLCGAFNERLVHFALDDLARLRIGPGARLVLAIGTRLAASWRAEAEEPEALREAPATVEALSRSVAEVLTLLDRWRAEERVARILLFHQRPGPGFGAVPDRADLFPLAPGFLAALGARDWPSRRLPACAGPPEALFRSLVRQLLFARLHTAIVQSRTAEHAERLAAMQAADRSIAEKLDELRVAHRLRRQDVITAELLDLVSGFEAATGGEGGLR